MNQSRPLALEDKEIPMSTFLHYTDPTSHKERTVYGRHRKGLFYNYDDRLASQEWYDAIAKAKEQAEPKSAKYYEIALASFHGVDKVELEHVILGCNRATGYSYLVFGYTY